MGILRFLLATAVVLTHFFGNPIHNSLVGGQVAVQSFYIISGFYMSLIWSEKYKNLKNSYGLFITNRFLRLYPIFWTVLILSGIFSWIIYSKNPNATALAFWSQTKMNLSSFLLLAVSNVMIIGQDLTLFLGIQKASGSLFFTTNFLNTSPHLYDFSFIPQAWTLSLEIIFYLLAPFLFKKGSTFILLLIACSVTLRFILYNFFNLQEDPWTYRFFPTEIAFFLLGHISYKLYLKIPEISISTRTIKSFFISLLLLTIFYQYMPALKISFIPFSGKEIFYFSCILLGVPFLFSYFKHNSIDTKIGELSYPIYISHMLVGNICKASGILLLDNNISILVITILFSYLVVRLISNPIDRYREMRVKRIILHG